MSEDVSRSHRISPWVMLLAVVLVAALGLVLVMAVRSPRDVGGALKDTMASGLPLTPEQRSVEFRHADLSFEVFPDRQAIAGKAVLTLVVGKPIARIQFDLDRELPISSLSLNGQALASDRWRNPDGRATVELGRTAQPGETLTLAIAYAGRPHVAKKAPWDGGFVWSRTPAGAPWVATAVEGEGCDLFWPCFDNSMVEVGTVDLHITVPHGLVAPSNGRLVSVSQGSDGRPTYNWRTEHPNNYAIALNVAPYRVVSGTYASRFGNRIAMDYWYLPGEEKQAKALFSEFAPTLDFFEEMIGPYPFGGEKVGVVETPHLGMEHQTINAYGNAYKQAPEGFDWLFQHEFSHEWFGNQLTNADWDDMWLHEGFGTYMQPLYSQWRGGQISYDAWLWRLRGTIMNRHPIVTGTHRTEAQVYNPATGPGLDIYNKGAWVLHTLRGMIGDAAFFRSIRREVYGRVDPAPGNFVTRFGSTNEFVAIVNQESKRDLGWFFDVYLRQAKLPLLVDRRDGNRLVLQWRTPRGLPFPMPVEVAIDGTVQTVAMTGGKGELTLPSPRAHVTIDPQGKLLRQSDEMDRFRDFTDAAKTKAAGGKS